MSANAHICRLVPVGKQGDFLQPGVYVAFFPGSDDDDPEAVVGFLALQSIHQVKAVQLMAGLTLEEADSEGFYFRTFDHFADMADTIAQGFDALNGEGGE